MAEAPSPNNGAGKDEKPPNDDAFELQTQSIFKSFMYERLTSQIEEEACEGQMSIGDIPKPVLEQVVKESSKDEMSKEDRVLGKVILLVWLNLCMYARITCGHSWGLDF